jgi:hypothetical protein
VTRTVSQQFNVQHREKYALEAKSRSLADMSELMLLSSSKPAIKIDLPSTIMAKANNATKGPAPPAKDTTAKSASGIFCLLQTFFNAS